MLLCDKIPILLQKQETKHDLRVCGPSRAYLGPTRGPSEALCASKDHQGGIRQFLPSLHYYTYFMTF